MLYHQSPFCFDAKVFQVHKLFAVQMTDVHCDHVIHFYSTVTCCRLHVHALLAYACLDFFGKTIIDGSTL
jgi:hypothetical protein